jgi:hypothetical protein
MAIYGVERDTKSERVRLTQKPGMVRNKNE